MPPTIQHFSHWIYTMQCWTRFFASFLLSFLAIGAQAQGLTREAPKDVTPAIIAVSATPPIITVNGQPDRLSPGSRVRDLNNMLVLSGAMQGQTLVVNYTLDTQGGVLDVWLLSPLERARQPWPGTAAQAQAWFFNADAQTWSRP